MRIQNGRLNMKKYTVVKEFKGSTTGSDVVLFEKDKTVNESILGKSLLDVAIEEKWVKADKSKKSSKSKVDEAALVNAISELDFDDESQFTSSGAPTTEALEKILGEKVSAADRDSAWDFYNAK
ncbi:MAG: hypothetical protein QM500_10915 [Methylococcales bacterium]